MSQSSAFQIWVDKRGGKARLAADLGVTKHVVRFWLERKGWPKVKNILEILELSRGELSFLDIVESTRPKAKGKKKC